MAKPNRLWGSYTRAYRDRATKVAATHGISRRSAREMFNRGTFKPFAKEPSARIPRKVAQARARSAAKPGPQPPTEAPPKTHYGREDKQALLLARLDFEFESRVKFTPNARAKLADRVGEYPEKRLDAMLKAIDTLSPADLAAFQKPSDAPREIRKMVRSFFYKNEDGKWINPFWYHP